MPPSVGPSPRSPGDVPSFPDHLDPLDEILGQHAHLAYNGVFPRHPRACRVPSCAISARTEENLPIMSLRTSLISVRKLSRQLRRPLTSARGSFTLVRTPSRRCATRLRRCAGHPPSPGRARGDLHAVCGRRHDDDVTAPIMRRSDEDIEFGREMEYLAEPGGAEEMGQAPFCSPRVSCEQIALPTSTRGDQLPKSAPGVRLLSSSATAPQKIISHEKGACPISRPAP
jgi:hypothetical protein